MRSPEDVDKLVWSPLNVQNPATYLASLKGRKVGVVVKGCDSRSVVELLQEKLIERDKVKVFGMPCSGVVELAKIRQALEAKGAAMGRVQSVEESGNAVVVTVDGTSHSFSMSEVAADKCLRCQYPNALLSDHFFGDTLPPVTGMDANAPDLAMLDSMSLPERMAFWRYHMDRCIRCHACRNACPLCVCKDHCIALSRDPHWISQEDSITEKLMFQVVHASHLSGRCTECGECQRACPMDIPILALKRQMNRAIFDLFEYRAGCDPQAVPPLLSFREEEQNIHEGGL